MTPTLREGFALATKAGSLGGNVGNSGPDGFDGPDASNGPDVSVRRCRARSRLQRGVEHDTVTRMEMADDTARVILLIGLALLMPVGTYYRLRSSTDERLDRRQEGWAVLVTLRPLALAFVIGMLTFVIHPPAMSWAAIGLPGWMRWLGVVCGLAAGALIVWTFQTLGRNLTDTVVTRRDATLVTNGPYRWVRHPFYVAFALAITAYVLITSNAFLAAAGSGAFLAIVARTSIEEQKLIDRFGDQYVEYMKRTGRFLPKIG